MECLFQHLCNTWCISCSTVLFKEFESFATLNKDLDALLQGSVTCRKENPPSTKETRKEAFDRYMKIIYRLPPSVKVCLFHVASCLNFQKSAGCLTHSHYIINEIMVCFQIDLEDSFDLRKHLCNPRKYDDKPINPPTVVKDDRPKPKITNPVNEEEKSVQTVCKVSKTFLLRHSQLVAKPTTV